MTAPAASCGATVVQASPWRLRIGAALDPAPLASFGEQLTLLYASTTAAAIASGHRIAGPSTARFLTNPTTGEPLTVELADRHIELPHVPAVAVWLVMATPITCTPTSEEPTP